MTTTIFIDLAEDPDTTPSPIFLSYRLGHHQLLEELTTFAQAGVHHVAFNLRHSTRPAKDSVSHKSSDRELGRRINGEIRHHQVIRDRGRIADMSGVLRHPLRQHGHRSVGYTLDAHIEHTAPFIRPQLVDIRDRYQGQLQFDENAPLLDVFLRQARADVAQPRPEDPKRCGSGTKMWTSLRSQRAAARASIARRPPSDP